MEGRTRSGGIRMRCGIILGGLWKTVALPRPVWLTASAMAVAIVMVIAWGVSVVIVSPGDRQPPGAVREEATRNSHGVSKSKRTA